MLARRSLMLGVRGLAAVGAPATSTDVIKFVTESLEKNNIKGAAAQAEVDKLKKNQVVTMDLLRGLNMHDWEKTGISVGAARAIQDSLWQVRQNEVMAKVTLRRENSTRQEIKQRRL
jgi:CRISPR/Cas system type I-B associated protein Csh2 (Cas7 group RAMP superfamily)